VGLPRLSGYLATIRGEAGGVTAVVYCQGLSQLEAVYGKPEAEAILTNCAAGQVFLPPKDLSTARYLSELFGEALEPVATASGGEQAGSTQGWSSRSHQRGQSTSWSVSSRYRPALTSAQAVGLPEGTVAVFAAGKRALLTDSRTVLLPRLAQLPPPPEPPRTADPGTGPDGSPPAPAPPAPAPAPPTRPPVAPTGQTTPPAAAKGLW
jgi:hypothetical protein